MITNPMIRAESLEERAYQSDLAEKVTKRNTLIVLPTALGKTVIAALAASHFLYNYGDKKVLVMAPTRPLVLQHRDTFLRLLKLRPQDVQVLTGKYPPNYRQRAWNGQARIYFATPQVVNNDHELGMSLRDFSLLVFDECHRAKKNYAYTRVAKAYVDESPHPIILGLTASPGADKKKIKEICDALYIEHVEARTEEDPDVEPYVSPVAVEWKFVKLPESYQTIRGTIKEMLDERLRKLSSMGVIKKPPQYIFRTDLLKASDELRHRIGSTHLKARGPLYGFLGHLSSALTLYHALELLESQGVHTLRCFLGRVAESQKRSHKGIFSEFTSKGVYDALSSGSLEDHPKIPVLQRIVLDQLSAEPSSKVIVFTQYRDTSSYLVSKLSEQGVAAARFVGQADKEKDSGLSQEQQAEILDKFRSGDLRVLVATSIGEEGLDIPSVELVVFYEPVPSEIRYIQRKGRTGRRKFGKAIILAAEDTLDVGYLHASRRMAERMKSIMKRLNTELQPIIRPVAELEKNPISPEVIAEAEKYKPELHPAITADEDLAMPDVGDTEEERLEKFNGEVREAAKRLLYRVLEVGRDGISIDELSGEFKKAGLDKAVTKVAIKKLKEEAQIEVTGDKIFPVGAEVAKLRPQDVYTFEVEKVLQGRAILSVDGKWHAVMVPEEYDGPRQLLKKGSRFRATAKLYKLDGKLHARIYSIETSLV